MTLATLKGMNFNMGDVANAFKLKAADTVVSGVQKVTETAATAPRGGHGVRRVRRVAGRRKATGNARPARPRPRRRAGGPAAVVGSLTQQFQQIAASAMKDAAKQTAMDTTKNMATGLAKEAFKAAPGGPRRRKGGRQKAAPARPPAAPLTRADEAVPLRPRHPSAMAHGRRAGAGAAARADGAARLRQRAHAGPALHHRPLRAHARDILEHLSAELPEVTDWAGTVGVGIAASNVEYFDEPALAVMLCELPPDQYRVFSGVAPLGTGPGMGFEPHTALVHADAGTPDVAELIAELAAAHRHRLPVWRAGLQPRSAVQFAVGGNGNIKGQGAASGVFSGGLVGRGLWRGRGPGVARDAGLPARGAGAHDHGGRRQRHHWAGRRTRRWTCCCATWPSRWTSPRRPWPRCAPRWWA
jgi:hypothetical protein